MTSYSEIYQQSLADPDGFWSVAARQLHWESPWVQVLDRAAKPAPRWFVGGSFNTCYNALDRHVENGRGEQAALIYDSPVTGQKRSYTYSELTDLVARVAGVLRDKGVEKGDRVILYMPMIPEAAIGMLACARIGAVHSVVFGGFAANELATRIDDAKPKVILSASCGIEPNRVVQYKPLLDAAIDQARHKPAACVIKQRPQAEASMIEGRDDDWDACVDTYLLSQRWSKGSEQKFLVALSHLPRKPARVRDLKKPHLEHLKAEQLRTKQPATVAGEAR